VSEQIRSGRIPSGWYPDPSPGVPAGQLRYWDGSAWTEHTTAPSTAPTVAEPARRPGIMLTRWGFLVLVGVLAFLFGVGIGAAGDTIEEPATAASETSGEPAPVPTVTVDPSAARQAELDQLAADLDAIAAEQATMSQELAAKEAELEAREQAVAAAEQERAVEPEPPAAAPAPEAANDCHPSYDPCVPIASDVDCEGGSGNGPEYTGTVRVIGPDEYDLDRDGDGVACDG
jgi:hypothetical protein